MAIIQRILVPTDFSDCARRALDYAAELANRLSASIVVAHIYVPPVVYMPEGVWAMPDAFPDARKDLEQAMARLAAQVREKKVAQVETVIVEGDPSHEIVKVAQQQKCDLVVLGTHGRTGVRHLVLGSVAEKVVRRSTCPVLTVGPRADAPAGSAN
jgi:nucleotide-binding universal stress UspA family protein